MWRRVVCFGEQKLVAAGVRQQADCIFPFLKDNFWTTAVCILRPNYVPLVTTMYLLACVSLGVLTVSEKNNSSFFFFYLSDHKHKEKSTMSANIPLPLAKTHTNLLTFCGYAKLLV